jgi:hypothetical protein
MYVFKHVSIQGVGRRVGCIKYTFKAVFPPKQQTCIFVPKNASSYEFF